MEENKIVIGIDEAGRGPWAGPVVACAAYVPKNIDKDLKKDIKDSKKISEIKRNQIANSLKEVLVFGVGKSSAKRIDKIGIKKANKEAMNKAIRQLQKKFPRLVITKGIVDGNDKYQLTIDTEDLIKGDEKDINISAASIMAKSERDKIMAKAAEKYPNYSFEEHKGYGTKAHKSALEEYGPIEIHRFSFAPIKNLL